MATADLIDPGFEVLLLAARADLAKGSAPHGRRLLETREQRAGCPVWIDPGRHRSSSVMPHASSSALARR